MTQKIASVIGKSIALSLSLSLFFPTYLSKSCVLLSAFCISTRIHNLLLLLSATFGPESQVLQIIDVTWRRNEFARVSDRQVDGRRPCPFQSTGSVPGSIINNCRQHSDSYSSINRTNNGHRCVYCTVFFSVQQVPCCFVDRS